MENYERDDAFFDSVNKNKRTTDIVANVDKVIDKNATMYARRIADSKSAQKKYEERVRRCERNNLIKRIAVAASTVAILAGGITAVAVHGEDYVNTQSGINVMTRNANRIIEAKGLSHYSMIDDNSVSDYKKLNISSLDEVYVYIYKSVISSSEEEREDFIKSVSYVDENDQKCYYTDFNDFLTRNNFKDEAEFKDYARKFILENYELGLVEELPYEGIGTVNRGGKAI